MDASDAPQFKFNDDHDTLKLTIGHTATKYDALKLTLQVDATSMEQDAGNVNQVMKLGSVN